METAYPNADAELRRRLLTRRPVAQPAQPLIQKQGFSDTREQDFRRKSADFSTAMPAAPAAPTLPSPPPMPAAPAPQPAIPARPSIAPFSRPPVGIGPAQPQPASSAPMAGFTGQFSGPRVTPQVGAALHNLRTNPNNLINRPATPMELARVNPQSAFNVSQRMASPNPMIGDVERSTSADLQRQGIVARAQSTGQDLDAVLRGDQVQAANTAMDMSPRGQQNARIQAGAAAMQPKMTPEAAMDVLNAQPKTAPDRAAQIRQQQVASIQRASADARDEEGARRRQLSRYNIARNSEKPGQLEAKRTQRYAMGAANRMFAAANQDQDPKARAIGRQGALEMGINAINQPKAPRTTFADIQRQDEGMAFQGQQNAQNQAFELEKARLRGTSQPKPALSPEKQAVVQGYVAEMRAAGTKPERRAELQNLIKQAITGEAQGKSPEDIFDMVMGMFGGGTAPQQDAVAPAATAQSNQPAPQPQAPVVDYSDRTLPDGWKLQRSRSTGEQWIVRPGGPPIRASEFFRE